MLRSLTERLDQNEDEFLLDAPDAAGVDSDPFIPEELDGDESMVVDEEGRPKFAPAKDIVRMPVFHIDIMILTEH